MGEITKFWAQVDALAEKQRAAWPKWIVWEEQAPETDELFSAPNEEEAREAYRKAYRFGEPERQHIRLKSRPATPADVKAWEQMMAAIPRPAQEERAEMERRGQAPPAWLGGSQS